MAKTKVYFWYKHAGCKTVVYDIVIIDGDYDAGRKQRLYQLKQYKLISNRENILYSTRRPL